MLPVTWLEQQANTNPVHTTGADGERQRERMLLAVLELRNQRIASLRNGLTEQGGKLFLATRPQSDFEPTLVRHAAKGRVPEDTAVRLQSRHSLRKGVNGKAGQAQPGRSSSRPKRWYPLGQ
jgi:hypothetical protein